jgi:hypothetical protein
VHDQGEAEPVDGTTTPQSRRWFHLEPIVFSAIWQSVREMTMTRQRKAASRNTTRKTSGSPLRRKTPRKASSSRTSSARRGSAKRTPKRWSQRVTKQSDALDLKHGVFKQTSARRIAASLKRSAEASRRRKSGAYRSALSMLTFYINRAGKNLPKTQKSRLERAKLELKHLFGKE